MSDEEIKDLIAQYKSCKDEKKRRVLHLKIVELALSYVRKIVASPSYRSYKISEDLFQVGSIGLMKAIEFFEPDKNAQFKTYATYFIKGEIKHYLRDKYNFIKPPREIQELSYKINLVSRELVDEGKDGTSVKLIAERLELPTSKVEDILTLGLGQDILSLDQTIASNEEEEFSLMDKIPDGDYKDFLASSENRLMLSFALEKLPKDMKEILIMHFYKDINQKQIAEMLNFSPMQVSRKIKKAINKLYEIVNRKEDKE